VARALPTLSAKQTLVLELLLDGGEMYGLELVAASRRGLKRGTVYVTLGRMEEKGYLTSRRDEAPADEGGLPRRRYAVTPLGRRVFNVYAHAMRILRPELAR